MNETIPPRHFTTRRSHGKRKENAQEKKRLHAPGAHHRRRYHRHPCRRRHSEPRRHDRRSEGRHAKIQSDLSTIGTAMEVYHVKKGGTYPTDLSTLAGDNGYLKKVPEPPTGAGAYTVGSKGEVTCTFNGVTYSSFGTSMGNADSNAGK